MSGLVGLVTFDGRAVAAELIERMAAAAPHRGEDGSGVWVGPGAGLGQQRRRILAGGADGDAPAQRDGLVCIADARVDNRDELLAALGPLGDEPLTEAELLLAAYRHWGPGCARRIIGDFAFAVWDTHRRILFAARDPMAMRSLAYYSKAGRVAAVATEVKQLLTLPMVPVRLHEAAVLGDLLCTFGRPEWSFYEGIANLAPGHTLLVSEQGCRTEPFWMPDPTFRISLDERACAGLVRDRFIDAVAARLRTDRPAGVLLSGGVDSGSVAAAAGWLLRRSAVQAPSLHAFSWAFERLTQCDERAVSGLIVNAYGLDETYVPADDAGPLAGFPDHAPDRDDPFLGAFQPLIERSLAAARSAGVGVLLGGDRGDLVFGDVGWSYLRLAQSGQWTALRSELAEHRRVTADGWARILRRHLVDAVAGRLRSGAPLPGRLRALVRRRGRPAPPAPPPWMLAAPGGTEDAPGGEHRTGFSGARAVRRDWIFTQLHIRGMAWSERTYARFGLGFADPFSDRRVVELALALPQMVINRPGDQSKPLMRAAMKGIVPEAARGRLDKVVPTPLYEHALRHDAEPVVRELLTDPQLAQQGWVDADAWRAHYEQWRSGGGPLRAEWWWTLGVEIWLRRHW